MCQEPVWFQSWSVTAADVVRFRAGNLCRDLFKALRPCGANGLTAISNQLRNWFPGLFLRAAALDTAVSARSDGPSSSEDGWMACEMKERLRRVNGYAGISLCAKLLQMAGHGQWKITFLRSRLIQNLLDWYFVTITCPKTFHELTSLWSALSPVSWRSFHHQLVMPRNNLFLFTGKSEGKVRFLAEDCKQKG